MTSPFLEEMTRLLVEQRLESVPVRIRIHGGARI